MTLLVGIVVWLVLAQLIDGRVAYFVGVGVSVALSRWRRGSRNPSEFVGVAFASAIGLAVFFVLIRIPLFASGAVMGWAALFAGAAATIWISGWWSGRLLMKQVNSLVAQTANELGVSTTEALSVIHKAASGDREGAIAEVAAQQEKQREALKSQGIDVDSIEPEVGKLIGWDQIARHSFRILSFDRSDTTIADDGTVVNDAPALPYGYLRVESPILNQPIRLPIIHRDDFWLAASAFDEPLLTAALEDQTAELLVTYAPFKMLAGGLNGTPQHCLHYVLCPRGTLELYYPNSPIGGRRMAMPEPELLFGQFVYDGMIKVGTNQSPPL